MLRTLPTLILVSLFAAACGGAAAETSTTPAPEPVVANQACDCSCECDAAAAATDEACECACQCGGAAVPTETAVASPPAETAPPATSGADDTVEYTDWSGRTTKVDDLHYRISREAMREALDNPQSVARGARIVPSIKDGKANGFKLYAIRPSSIYANLGIMNGDTIHAINGLPLNSPDEALELYSKVREADRLELQLTRRGKSELLVIEIE